MINPNTFTNFLSNFFLLYVLKNSNYCMKILSKHNVEKLIVLLWRKKKVVVKNQVLKLSFVLYKCLDNIWMVPKQRLPLILSFSIVESKKCWNLCWHEIKPEYNTPASFSSWKYKDIHWWKNSWNFSRLFTIKRWIKICNKKDF